ncbi:TIGR03085 family metal-binding protein [Corynebacterium lowii]|uniref:Mycothiol-dependent maleylpyruvate isomerase metal-binding domain-containing protein n=1 Tax=Corynebacterium lowii TaxID=1544413 RepID=A0A0N8W0F8_9CORY|nr:TIGR03085 family metal-binding protein [Corynebacterium lowii]KQB86578.1 hypothetical protein Clow_00786 [Corynebacterium lowii]MDP9851262.1 uncharacterized protein (TIGR03085 family) [Corynebacterium lowii]
MSFVATERAKLRDLLLDLGPQALTLCEGWLTQDMAVHLWLRERRPDALAGIMVPALSGHLDNLTRAQKARPYEAVVREWGAGPGTIGRLSYALRNTAEHFVHHEDVRRGGGVVEPRDFSARVNELLWGQCSRMAPLLLRGNSRPVILEGRGMRPIVAADRRGVVKCGDAVLRVKGEPGEVMLWCFGRSAVEVEIEGEEPIRSSL